MTTVASLPLPCRGGSSPGRRCPGVHVSTCGGRSRGARPQVAELVHGVGVVAELAEDRADGHHQHEVVDHVGAQRVAVDVVVQVVVGVHHDARDANLLVNAPRHDLLVDALVLAADEVVVQVHVQVVDGLAAGERDVGIDVVHIERVGRHGHAAVAQDVRPVAERVHEQVLRHHEVAHVVPAEGPAHGEGVAVVDRVPLALEGGRRCSW